jgi:lambda repressor-like predicted transcriptional regulator
MANDLLIAAITESGLSIEDVADVAQVDPRTVQRWLGGRLPHPRYRQKLAAKLGLEERELWPDVARVGTRGDMDELAGAWARRSDPDAPDWRALMRAAERKIDLVGYSLLHILEARAITKQLTDKARAGCQVRIAIVNPDADHVLAAGLRQRPPGRLIARIKDAQRRLAPLASAPGIEVRQHDVATSHTILRSDDQMLLTIHLYGTPGFQAPLIHLRRERDYGIFDQLATHIEDLWENAAPLEGPKPETAVPTPVATNHLDDLDYIWRPGGPPRDSR